MRKLGTNPFALGLFCLNVAGGAAMLKHDLWDPTWDDTVAAARGAEAAGLEFLLPLGRWRGWRDYPVETDDEGGTFECLSWAAGILALTSKIAVFGTLHVPFVNPVFAAKQIVTIHHIGHGRFGLNVVSGTTEPDFGMMGIAFDEHDARYDYTEEWVSIVKRIWTSSEPFDHTGKHFRLTRVLEKPKPYDRQPPMIISAGHSPRGRAFALREADALFTSFTEIENVAEELRLARASAPGRENKPAYASGHLVTRPTRKACEEYYHHLVYDLGYWDGVEATVQNRLQNRALPVASVQALRERAISGTGTFCVRGSYDDVAETFKKLHEAGLNGMAIALPHFLDDLPALRDEVLPRMERLGLRRTV